MDSLTQIVLGAGVGEVLLGKKAGNKAMLWGAVAGTIPDLDVFVKLFTDDVSANEMHRGFSHSLVFCLIAAPILGWLIQRLYRKKKATTYKDWSKLSFWAFVTHPLLDAHTTWGTQFFWPFDLRLAYKNINVIDPLYTVPFLLLLIAVLFIKRNNGLRRKLAWLGIGLSSFYMVLTIGAKWHVRTVVTDDLQHIGLTYNRLSVQPTFMNAVLWFALVETDSAYHMAYYSLLDEGKSLDWLNYEKDLDVRQSLGEITMYQRLVKLSDEWYLVRSEDSAYRFYDMRFGQISFEPNINDIVFNYKLQQTDGKWEAEQAEPPRENMPRVLQALFQRMKGIKKEG